MSLLPVLDAGVVMGQLECSVSSDSVVVKRATLALKECERVAGFGELLVRVVELRKADHVGLAAAIYLKNYLMRSWLSSGDDDECSVGIGDRVLMKQSLLRLLSEIGTAPIQAQLVECVGLVAASDFPHDWPEMLDGLKAQLLLLRSPIVVFRVLDAVFRKFRHACKSEKLWQEIRYVVDNFGAEFLSVYSGCMQSLGCSSSSSDGLVLARLCVEVLTSLVSQDLVDHVEENMSVYMDGMLLVLKLGASASDADDDLAELLTSVCDCSALLIRNYPEFLSFAEPFLEAVWRVLSNGGGGLRRDSVVCAAFRFLTDAAAHDAFAAAMSQEGALRALCENVIIPCIARRDEDLYDVEELVRRELDDDAGVRACAAQLINAFCYKMEAQVVGVFGAYIDALLSDYAATVNWRQKDVATFLLICVARRAQTAKMGATRVSSAVDLARFYTEFLAAHLAEQPPAPDITAAVLKVDAMKFISEFRHTLGDDVIRPALPHLVRLLNPQTSSVQTNYALAASAAHTLERLMNGVAKEIPLNQLVQALVQACKSEPDNEHAAQALLQCAIHFHNQLSAETRHALCHELVTIAQSAMTDKPRKPMFNHYCHETIGLLVSCYGNQLGEDCTNKLAQLYLHAIDQDVADVVPYALQMLALLAGGIVNGLDTELANRLESIAANLMDSAQNRPACVDLTVAIFRQSAQPTAAATPRPPDLNKVLKPVFQKLFNSRTSERDAIVFAEHILSISLDEPFLRLVFGAICRKLTRNRADKSISTTRNQRFVHDVIHLTSLLICLHPPDTVIRFIDDLQKGLFAMVMRSLFLAEDNGVKSFFMNFQRSTLDKKTVFFAVIRLLTESSTIADTDGHYADIFNQLLTKSIESAAYSVQHFNDGEYKTTANQESGLALLSSSNRLRFCKSLPTINPLQSMPQTDTWTQSVKQLNETLEQRIETLCRITENATHNSQRRFNQQSQNTFLTLTRQLNQIVVAQNK